MRKTKIFLDNFGLLTEISAFEVRPRKSLLFLRLFMVLIFWRDWLKNIIKNWNNVKWKNIGQKIQLNPFIIIQFFII